MLDLCGNCIGHGSGGFRRDDLISGYQPDRHTKVLANQSVDADLADDEAIDLRFPDRSGAVSVGENRFGGTDRAVIANEEGSIERVIKALEHVHWLEMAGDEAGPGVEGVRHEVDHPRVSVVDNDFMG